MLMVNSLPDLAICLRSGRFQTSLYAYGQVVTKPCYMLMANSLPDLAICLRSGRFQTSLYAYGQLVTRPIYMLMVNSLTDLAICSRSGRYQTLLYAYVRSTRYQTLLYAHGQVLYSVQAYELHLITIDLKGTFSLAVWHLITKIIRELFGARHCTLSCLTSLIFQFSDYNLSFFQPWYWISLFVPNNE
jgi:hypothetical protein